MLSFNMPEDMSRLRHRLDEEGYFFLSQRADAAYCRQVISFIDSAPDADAAFHYGGTEKRIWMAHEKNEAIASFRILSDQLLSALFGRTATSRDVLAIRNLPVGSDPGLSAGRWHLDSLRSQFKLFLFLTEVSEQSGPLEIVPNTHRALFKLGGTVAGHFIRPADLGHGTRRYQRLDDAWVQRTIERQGGSKRLVCAAGSMAVVNTGAIHRARPCLEANRYALTSYYDHF